MHRLPRRGWQEAVAQQPNTPKIGGASATHLEQSLRDFRSGKRSNVQMQPMAKGLSDADIKLLAQYFSSLK